jgi:hypothetical protein
MWVSEPAARPVRARDRVEGLVPELGCGGLGGLLGVL